MPPEDAARRANGLQAWLLENGGHLHRNVQILYTTDGKGYRLQYTHGHYMPPGADNECRNDQEIVNVPHSICFSMLQIPSIAPWLPTVWIDSQTPTVVTRFLLMESLRLGDESKFAPYMKCLPSPEDNRTPFRTPIYWTDSERAIIEGTNLAQAVRGRMNAWKIEFEAALASLLAHCTQEKQETVKSYSLWLYTWAATVLTSRCFPGRLVTPTNSHVSPVEPDFEDTFVRSQMYKDWLTKRHGFSFPVLLPVLDLANHDPQVEATWVQTDDAVKLITMLPASENDEVSNNYGQKSNEELIMGYGFDLVENPANHLALALILRDTDKLELVMKARTRRLAQEPQHESMPVLGASAEQIGSSTYALRKGTHPLASPAAGSLAIMAMNSVELSRQCEDPFSVPSFAGDKFPSRLALCCATAFFLQLYKQLSAIEAHGSNVPEIDLIASNAIMQMAIRYRDNQLAIMRDGIERCIRTVSRWDNTGRLLTLEAITTGFLPSAMLRNYRKVLHHVVGTRNEEKLLAGNHRDIAYVLWILLIVKNISNLDADVEADPVIDGVVTRASLQRWLRRLAAGYGIPGQLSQESAASPQLSEASAICWQQSMRDCVNQSATEYEKMILVSDLPESLTLQDFLIVSGGKVTSASLFDAIAWALRIVTEELILVPYSLLDETDARIVNGRDQSMSDTVPMMVFEDDVD